MSGVAYDPNGPLRLAYLTYRGKPHVGGQGVYTRHLTKALVDLGHSVEVFGGQPYPVLDEVLKLLIEGERLSAPELAAAQAFVAQLQTDGAGRALVQRVRMMVARNEYKRRQAPPILRVRPRAFGSGRQMPIAARYV